MGFSETSHVDGHNSGLGYSVMIVASDSGDVSWEDYGRFHWTLQGVYMCLCPWSTVFFTGRVLYGGTAPIAPKGVLVPEC